MPEGLPLVATVAQQAAARRLSRRGAVVRSARVLEALGRVDTVCFDKTGTLTENRLSVVRLLPLGDDPVDDEELLRIAVTAVAEGDAEAHETDRAVVEAAAGRGATADGDQEACLPFAAERGFSAALAAGRLVVKGAPEVVLRRCTDDGGARERVQELASDGLRVLAVADRRLDGAPDDLDDAAQGLTLRGLVGLADTLRGSSVAAIEQLRAAGVRVLVATGDHPETAGAIAAQAGIPDADRVITGAQLAKASDAERADMVRTGAVFARLSPEQKVTLVGALRRAGATLAMTGDGVNDAAAIRLADVGVGVSGAESPAARTAADLVLTDPDLTRLVDAIAEGRAMWSRVREALGAGRRQRRGGGLHRARHRGRRPRARSAPASCCWSTCSPTCSPRSPWPSPPPARRRWRRTPVRSPVIRWRRCCWPGRSGGSPTPSAAACLVRGAATTVGATVPGRPAGSPVRSAARARWAWRR